MEILNACFCEKTALRAFKKYKLFVKFWFSIYCRGPTRAAPINDLLNALRTEPSAGYVALAERLEVSEATIKRNIQKLKQQNRIRRIGSKKTGHWEVIE